MMSGFGAKCAAGLIVLSANLQRELGISKIFINVDQNDQEVAGAASYVLFHSLMRLVTRRRRGSAGRKGNG
jgi:hypothetical protein